jgi:CDP-diacylglycerol---glycerol-3-phosphate 3-phosphatidyltransferase
LNVANIITCMRIIVSPVFLLIYMKYESFGISFGMLPYVLTFLLILIEGSDIIDGYVARKLNQVTDIGKIFDPIADSIARISIFLTFTVGIVQLPLILVFIFIYREFIVNALRIVCALNGFALAARLSGKIKAVIQAICAFCIIILMLLYSLNVISIQILRNVSVTIVSLACLYSIFSCIEYFYVNRKHVKKMFCR